MLTKSDDVGEAPVEERWAPPPAEPRIVGTPDALHVEEQRAGAAPRLRADARAARRLSRASSQSLQRTAKGSARSRFSAISSPQSKQLP